MQPWIDFFWVKIVMSIDVAIFAELLAVGCLRKLAWLGMCDNRIIVLYQFNDNKQAESRQALLSQKYNRTRQLFGL
jgi:hypothetical protein